MVEARVIAAEKEIELLSKSLSREKTVSIALRSQLKEILERSGEAIRQQQSLATEYRMNNYTVNKGTSVNIESINEFLEKYINDFTIDESQGMFFFVFFRLKK